MKNDGSKIRGMIKPFIIPYSFMTYEFVYPFFNRHVVNIIGSRKKPMVPIILLNVVGMAIPKMSLIFSLFGFRSFLEIEKFLGRKKNNTSIDVSSLMMLVKTMKATAYSRPYFMNIGIPIIRVTSLITSSVIFEITWGSMFCFPKK